MEGKTHVDPQVAGRLFAQIAQSAPSTPGDHALIQLLNDREVDILRLVARGLNNAEISQQLFLSEGTVRNYVSTIFNKLDVSDRTQAAVLALRSGLG
jgi:DNA-binding NarL/FixJ family response regulator